MPPHCRLPLNFISNVGMKHETHIYACIQFDQYFYTAISNLLGNYVILPSYFWFQTIIWPSKSLKPENKKMSWDIKPYCAVIQNYKTVRYDIRQKLRPKKYYIRQLGENYMYTLKKKTFLRFLNEFSEMFKIYTDRIEIDDLM